MIFFEWLFMVHRLRQCPHWNRSDIQPGDRIQVCFDCGATRRPDEGMWTQPWYWRAQPTWKPKDVKRAA